MLSKRKHLYHMVDMSIWPIMTSLSLLVFTIGIVMLMHKYNGGVATFTSGLIVLTYCLYKWWNDVVTEGLVGKHHTAPVRNGFRIGMSLFIISETMLFFPFFFSYFLSSLFPTELIDGFSVITKSTWPPNGIKTLDPWDIPFLNTLILLLSGTTVTWAHHAVEYNNKKDSVTSLGITIILGISFSLLQIYEYYHSTFKLTDGVYAANFYLITGLHGIHVMVGTIFLSTCYFRARKGHFVGKNSYLGFEFAAWYWHFIDVIWLLLFIFIYVLGS